MQGVAARLDQQIPRDKLIDYGLGYWDITDPKYPNYVFRYITNPSTSALALALPPQLPPVPWPLPKVTTSKVSLLQRDIIVSSLEINVIME
jgi:hypothetical protein